MIDEARYWELRSEMQVHTDRIETALMYIKDYPGRIKGACSDTEMREQSRLLDYHCKLIIQECLNIMLP